MTPEQRNHIEKLWKLQETAHKTLQEMADYMAKVAPINALSQERWDQLTRSWEDTFEHAKKIDEALRKLHRLG